MSDSPMPERSYNQERIWGHFQNDAPESFAAAGPRLDFLVRQIRKHCPGEKPVVLNIGVGNGYFERRAIGQGWEVHSLDPDRRALASLAGLGVAGHAGSIEAVPLPDESCDAVVASEVLEHLTEGQGGRAASEIARVLKPRGVFLGTVPYGEDLAAGQVVCPRCGELFHRWGHHRRFTTESLRRHLAEHFRVEEIRRTAFVAFRGRGLGGMAKSLARLILARQGQMIAVPSLYWRAGKA